MKLYRLNDGALVATGEERLFAPGFSFDGLFRESDPASWLRSRLSALEKAGEAPEGNTLPPIESQEVWAAGVTYRRSRQARREESEKEADVYDRVYRAERPELFFKATAHRVIGHGKEVGIRSDSEWNGPEAELALAITSGGRIFG